MPTTASPRFLERFSEERRNVRVRGWLLAARYDNAGPPHERQLQVIVGSAPDTMNAVCMVIQIPDNDGVDNPEQFAGVWRQLLKMLPDLISPTFQPIAPRPVMVEGALFFNGRRAIADTAAAWPWSSVRTVWEIHPVTSITAIIAAD